MGNTPINPTPTPPQRTHARLTMIARLLIVIALATTASAYFIDVGSNVLGAGSPFETAAGVSAAEWYDYDNAFRSSSDTPDDVEREDAMVVSIVKDNNGLHYVAVINDIPNDEEGGSSSLVITCGNGSGQAAQDACNAALSGSAVVLDDTGETQFPVPDTPNTYQVNHGWVECCTDGIMFGPFDSDAVDIFLTNTARENLDNGLFIAYSDNGTTSYFGPFGINETVRIYGGFQDLNVPFACDCSGTSKSSDTNSVTLAFADNGVSCA